MANKYIHNNPQDIAKEICVSLEAQVTNINHHMNLPMMALARTLRSLKEVIGSNSNIILEGKLVDN